MKAQQTKPIAASTATPCTIQSYKRRTKTAHDANRDPPTFTQQSPDRERQRRRISAGSGADFFQAAGVAVDTSAQAIRVDAQSLADPDVGERG